jgi:hypothetical protein
MSKRITFFISPFILLFFTLGTMSGQTTRGTILGSVTDQAGAVVSEADTVGEFSERQLKPLNSVILVGLRADKCCEF